MAGWRWSSVKALSGRLQHSAMDAPGVASGARNSRWSQTESGRAAPLSQRLQRCARCSGSAFMLFGALLGRLAGAGAMKNRGYRRAVSSEKPLSTGLCSSHGSA